MKLDLKKNFDFNKIKINQMSSAWLNTIARHINLSIQEGLEKSVDLDGKPFKPVSELLKKLLKTENHIKGHLLDLDGWEKLEKNLQQERNYHLK